MVEVAKESLPHDEYSSRKEGIFNRGRNARGERGDDFVINSLIPSDEGDKGTDLDTFVKELQQKNPEYYEKFMEAFFDLYHVKDPALRKQFLEDPDLRKQFLALMEEGIAMKGGKSLQQYQLFKEGLMKKTGGRDVFQGVEKTGGFDRIYHNYVFLQKMNHLRDKILATGNKEAIKIWYDGIKLLGDDYKDGKIATLDDFLNRLEQIYSAAVEKTGDKELMEIWQAYKTSDARSSVDILFTKDDASKEVIPENPDDKPASKKEIQSAITQVQETSGYKMEQDSQGDVKFLLDNDVSVDVSVFVNDQSGEYVFYLNDEFVNGPSLRVEAKDLQATLYKRHIDGRITTRFYEKYPKFSRIIAEMPDQKITHLCETILGDKKDRGYKIEEDDLKVLNALVDLLMQDDEKYPSLGKKIEVLDFALDTRDKGHYVYDKLLTRNISSVSELLSEFHLT